MSSMFISCYSVVEQVGLSFTQENVLIAHLENTPLQVPSTDPHLAWGCKRTNINWVWDSPSVDQPWDSHMGDVAASPCLISSICLLGVLPLVSRQPIRIHGNTCPVAERREGGECCRKELSWVRVERWWRAVCDPSDNGWSTGHRTTVHDEGVCPLQLPLMAHTWAARVWNDRKCTCETLVDSMALGRLL